ncbi:MAG: ABC transporter substrate-binding protein, partial [Polyangiaceae bacterium]
MTRAGRTCGLVAIFLGVAMYACGGGSSEGRPVATVASTTASAAALEDIRDAWDDRATGPGELRLRLDRFLRLYPDDGAIDLVHVYYAQLLLDLNDTAGAERELAAADAPKKYWTAPHEGSTRNFYLVARARLLRMQGRPGPAFEILRPLAGKIVDPQVFELFQQEITLDAVASHQSYEAIAYMDSWLRNADEDNREVARAEIPKALRAMPTDVLENSLRSMRANATPSGYGIEIQKLISTRLAEVAVQTGNTRLANWLVDPSAGGMPILDSDAGLLVSELATRHHDVTTVDRRSIGLVLPAGNDTLRDQAADVMRGVAWGLELPRVDPNGGDQTRLVTRDDGGHSDQLEAVLDDLSGEGAVVILCALDTPSADRAVRWSEQKHVPVVTFAASSRQNPVQYAYILGVPAKDQLDALANVLAPIGGGKRKVAPVVDSDLVDETAAVFASHPNLVPFQPVACELGATHAGEARFPLAAWEKAGVKAWFVAGPEDCAHDLLHEIGPQRDAIVALSLEAEGATDQGLLARVLGVSAGSIPYFPGATAPDADIAKFTKSFGANPTWASALGRDAAILARHGVASLPLDATSDANEVAKRRAAVASALGVAKASLWTSETSGFASSHRLSR